MESKQEKEKSEREKKIFRLFAKVCPLSILPESITKADPPNPDILCEVEGGKQIAFELGEIIDESFAMRTNESNRLQQLLITEYQNLSSNELSDFNNKFGNALIYVVFKDGISSKNKSNVISSIIDILQNLPNLFSGNILLTDYPHLNEVLKRMSVSRGDFVGPCFDVCNVGSFADATVPLIDKKFKKQYESSFPIDFLAYYELQPVLPQDQWVNKVNSFITKNMKGSKFNRIWIYDIFENKILMSSENNH